MTRRPAATLLEVLVAIFVMGIGLLAILTLFPLGALRMAQAIQDDRAAHISASASSIAQALDLRSDPLVTAAFRRPGGGLPDAHIDGPGYPVYVDPVGYQTLLAPAWVGGVAGIPRRPASFVMNVAGTAPDPVKVLRWFTFLDDVRFGPDGVPGALVEREADYSWAYLLRCPRSSEAVADLSVVVYRRRPLSPGGNFTGDEYAYDNSLFYPATNTILIAAAGRPAPPLRPGSWILDATLKPAPYAYAHGYFYRVVSVTEVPAAAGGSDFEVEVATPLRGWPPGGGPGRVIVMDNVIEVFERNTGWAQ